MPFMLFSVSFAMWGPRVGALAIPIVTFSTNSIVFRMLNLRIRWRHRVRHLISPTRVAMRNKFPTFVSLNSPSLTYYVDIPDLALHW